MQTKKNEIWVGIFLLAALLAALFVCLKAANVTSIRTEPTYSLYATFDNIGGLKARSPVSIGGVVVGRVADITLDPKTYLPRVELDIDERYNHGDCYPEGWRYNSGHQVCDGAGRSYWSVPLR